MTPAEFIAKWRNVQLTERSASQQHFLDVCDLVGHPKPAAMDKTGESFTFERGAAKKGDGFLATGQGWADVWKKGFFAWEYKGRHQDLNRAYAQLQQYREDLESPPLLVVSDMDRIVIHTNFTATPVEVHEIRLGEIGELENIETLHALFHDPERLRPGLTSERITGKAAATLAELAQSLRGRGCDPHQTARFLDRIVFCLFAEDIALLPEGLFTRLLGKTRTDPAKFAKYCGQLFLAMADGGDFNLEDIRHFNGNLFDECTVLELTSGELKTLHTVAQLDWSAIDPSIFGTLFERGMDPAKRSQLGAHYTSRDDIETLIEPVVMLPLRRAWAQTRTAVEWLLACGRKPGAAVFAESAQQAEVIEAPADARKPSPRAMKKARDEAVLIVRRFHEKLSHVNVLDPACGSGNFLYVTLQKLKDLEKALIVYCQDKLGESFFPLVGPWQLHGIELNPYAYDLAQMTVWIGYLQWTRANGFGITQSPVLRTMAENFQNKDAILDLSDPANPQEPEWPKADCIVGNPPFLGGKMLRRELGDTYVDRLFALWENRVPREADLCCYWFEKARACIAAGGGGRRAGLLGTQGIRGGASRDVLRRIKETGDIFFAESDRPWVLDGASVHISMVGFDAGDDIARRLDGAAVATIHANLTAAAGDPGSAPRLPENAGLAFMGTTKQGSFEIRERLALDWLRQPNPHGRPNSDVLVPWRNGQDIARRPRDLWIVDNFNLGLAAAQLYERPFAHLEQQVLPGRQANPRPWNRREWWQLYAQRPDMRAALAGHARFVATPTVAKHRLFSWLAPPTNPDHQLIVFARSDDYFFGMLHSRLHEIWSLAQGTQLEDRPRYTPTTCFETFPFPWPPGCEPAGDPLVAAIAESAKELNGLRENWLNPPEWTRLETLEFPAADGGPWTPWIANPLPAADGVLDIGEAEPVGIAEFHQTERLLRQLREEARRGRPRRAGEVGTAKYPRPVPKDEACAKLLARRTLTNLYNERPAWLANAHRKLDEAVCAAYAATAGGEWSPGMPEAQILEQLLALNLQRS